MKEKKDADEESEQEEYLLYKMSNSSLKNMMPSTKLDNTDDEAYFDDDFYMKEQTNAAVDVDHRDIKVEFEQEQQEEETDGVKYDMNNIANRVVHDAIMKAEDQSSPETSKKADLVDKPAE